MTNLWHFLENRNNVTPMRFNQTGNDKSFWDPHATLLPDGRIRVVVMNQHGPPVPPAVPKGTIYSFTSENHGTSFSQDPGIRLRYDYFTEFQVLSLNDPKLLRLPDGRYRIYLAAMISDGSGNNKWAILSATTLPPTSVKHNEKTNEPAGFRLYPNYPNPFNPSTTICFLVPPPSKLALNGKPDNITLKVFDVNGQVVATLVNEILPAGKYQTTFTPDNTMSSGVYFFTLSAENYRQTFKAILMR